MLPEAQSDLPGPANASVARIATGSMRVDRLAAAREECSWFILANFNGVQAAFARNTEGYRNVPRIFR